MLGDLIIAEPGALIGFAATAGDRQTIRQKLPEGFQRSEFLLKHGMLDAVAVRARLKQYVLRRCAFLWTNVMPRVLVDNRSPTVAAPLHGELPRLGSVYYAWAMKSRRPSCAWSESRGPGRARPPAGPHAFHSRGRHEWKGLHVRSDRLRPTVRGAADGTCHVSSLVRTHERIQIDGEPIFAARFLPPPLNECRATMERFLAIGAIDLHTT